MAHLWIRMASADWLVLPLESHAYALDAMPPRPVSPFPLEHRERDSFLPPAAVRSQAVAPLEVQSPSAAAPTATEARQPHALLLSTGADETESWFAIADGVGEIVVNGLPLRLGVRALSDRDEIRIPGTGPMFFSTETLARPVPYPGAPQPVNCARCHQELMAGITAVRCPRCGVWHHECDELHCWTYDQHCQLCPQPSALDAGYRWSPEDL